jgi:hypothetical protein
MRLFLSIAGLLAVAISETMGDPKDFLPTAMPALFADTVCPGQRHFCISYKKFNTIRGNF